MKMHGGTCNVFYQVKEANLKKLHDIIPSISNSEKR